MKIYDANLSQIFGYNALEFPRVSFIKLSMRIKNAMTGLWNQEHIANFPEFSSAFDGSNKLCTFLGYIGWRKSKL